MLTSWSRTIAKIILVIMVPPILLLGNAYFFLSPALISYEYGKSEFPPSERFTPGERLTLSKKIVSYLKNETEAGKLQSLSLREISHLTDVKHLFSNLFAVQKISAALILIAILILAADKQSRRLLPLFLSFGGLLTFILLTGLLAASFINFDWLFGRFHRLFFTGNSWLFFQNSTLIQLYPGYFWQEAAKLLFIITLAESMLLMGGFFIGRDR